MTSSRYFMIFIFLPVNIFMVSPASAQVFSDDFTSGIDTSYWTVHSNDTLYTWEDTNGEIRLQRPSGGSHVLQAIWISFRPIVFGDFDVSVDFRDAYIDRINGSPGNQVQLNMRFGSQAFSVVRSDEVTSGHNHHVWIDPPAQWRGAQQNNATSGTLRITRLGETVTGYFNAVQIHAQAFNDAPVSSLSFSLQNNQTTDSTSVVFDNFTITSDSIEDILSNIEQKNPLIISAQLYQNYPNPFNPVTTIFFFLSKAENVTLEVYNTLGQKTATLIRSRLPAGLQQTEFDAHSLPSGIYFYRIQAGDYIQVKKMILLK